MLPEADRERFRERATNIIREDRVIRPTLFRFTTGFINAARDFFSAVLARAVVFNMAVWFAVAVTVLAIGAARSDRTTHDALTYAARLALGSCLVPLAFLCGCWLAFGAFQNFGRFQVLLLAAVSTTLLPPLLTYLFLGHLNDKGVTLVTSLVTGSVASVAAALAETLKSRPSNAGEPHHDEPASRGREHRG